VAVVGGMLHRPCSPYCRSGFYTDTDDVGVGRSDTFTDHGYGARCSDSGPCICSASSGVPYSGPGFGAFFSIPDCYAIFDAGVGGGFTASIHTPTEDGRTRW
jgi:hypothetical protein